MEEVGFGLQCRRCRRVAFSPQACARFKQEECAGPSATRLPLASLSKYVLVNEHRVFENWPHVLVHPVWGHRH